MVRLTDHLDMTIVVEWEIPQIKSNKPKYFSSNHGKDSSLAFAAAAHSKNLVAVILVSQDGT